MKSYKCNWDEIAKGIESGEFKSVKEITDAYIVSAVSVYDWMKRIPASKAEEYKIRFHPNIWNKIKNEILKGRIKCVDDIVYNYDGMTKARINAWLRTLSDEERDIYESLIKK